MIDILWFAQILPSPVSNSVDALANSLAGPTNYIPWIPPGPHILAANQGKQPANFTLL